MSDPGTYRILVVDDEASVLVTYQLILEQQGYQVSACATSVDAISALRRQDFDLVLCDYSLEEQHTGFEVIAEEEGGARRFQRRCSPVTQLRKRRTRRPARTSVSCLSRLRLKNSWQLPRKC